MSSKKLPTVKVKPLLSPSITEKAERELANLKIKKNKNRNKIPPVSIKVDSEDFFPVSENGETYLLANIPSNVFGRREVSISYRSSATIDCGIDLKVPSGYKLTIDLIDELKEKGVEIYRGSLIGETRAILGIRHLGREVVVISHRTKFAKLKIEPVFELEFKLMK